MTTSAQKGHFQKMSQLDILSGKNTLVNTLIIFSSPHELSELPLQKSLFLLNMKSGQSMWLHSVLLCLNLVCAGLIKVRVTKEIRHL